MIIRVMFIQGKTLSILQVLLSIRVLKTIIWRNIWYHYLDMTNSKYIYIYIYYKEIFFTHLKKNDDKIQ